MFWDASALVPLLAREPRSDEMASLLRSDTSPTLWWATPIECQSALQRRRRDAELPHTAIAPALDRLRALMEDVDVVQPVEAVLRRAERLLGAHALRAADALQLAAALSWCEDAPQGESFVCLDDRLRKAATREGFTAAPRIEGE